ncbi:hypothetical protein WMY93_015744 [Mugilogobius chulae]|uniref:Cholesterol 24-hydroxylase n=1 Tax=Mugilogobius chulae TaxID=88201 RepID=A0AAW0NTJ2_9GOBI
MAVCAVLLRWFAPVLYVLLFVLFVAFLAYCAYIKYIHMKYDHIPGPPRQSFFFGHMGTFTEMTKKDLIVYDKCIEWSETYGPVYRLNVLHRVLIVVTCPEATKDILMSAKYPKDKFLHKKMFYLFGQRLLGNGLVTAVDHDLWYKHRRVMDPAFSSLYLRGLMGTFNERAEKLMERLSEEAENQTEVSMLHMMNCVTMDVIAKVAFGIELELFNNNSPFPKAIETSLLGILMVARDVFFEYKPQNRGFIKEVREACRLLRSTGAQWINDRKKAMQNGEMCPKIFSHKSSNQLEKESMSKEDEEIMLDNFVTFFIAGQETTANQLAFCIMELGRHPEILEKLKQEIDEVIGMKRDISYDDLGNLTYLTQVLKETLRLYATAPVTNRDIPVDIKINGVHIPAGVTAMLSTYISSRMEKFFKDPLKFDPDRFHPDAPKPYYSYYPFSLGPRSCLGMNFAQMEAKVVMAKLIQRFDFTLVPGQNFDIKDTVTLRPKSRLFCTIRHRHTQ